MALKSEDRERAYINEYFIIKCKIIGLKGTKLVGAGQYEKLVGKELKIKHFKKVKESRTDVTTFKIRNRLKIDFHAK